MPENEGQFRIAIDIGTIMEAQRRLRLKKLAKLALSNTEVVRDAASAMQKLIESLRDNLQNGSDEEIPDDDLWLA